MKTICVLFATASTAAMLAGCASLPLAAAPLSVERAQNASDAGAVQPPRTPWALDRSDVKPDPAVRYGTLPNGMKYALRRNVTPPGEAALRLHIAAGSLMEREDQLGLAHFMEHMIFNGTKNVPEGEFTERLQRLGLSFGGHTNASTGFEETIYMLNLPETREEVVDTALLLLRETASEALLDPAAIDRERGVVLSEERLRGGPLWRNILHNLDFLFKGMLVPKRMPIGSTKIIANAPRERFLEFYEAWYRPENTTLIAVGDIDVDELERKIIARFGEWRGRGPAGIPPVIGEPAKRDTDVGVFVEPGVASKLAMTWVRPPDLDPDTIAERHEEFKEHLALGIFNQRLERIALGDNPPFTSAGLETTDSFKAFSSSSLSASFPDGGWKRALERLEREQRRAVQHGVTQEELDRAIRATRGGLFSGVAAVNTRNSSTLAGALLSAAITEKVVTTPQDRLTLFDQVTSGLTAAEMSNVLRGLLQGSGPLVYVSSPVPVTGGERAVAQALEQSRQVAVAAPASVPVKAWSYTSFGTPGQVAERREIADLGTTFIRFANGVRLTVRPSRKQENYIGVDVRVGDGELDLDPNRTTIAWAANATLVDGGLGRLTVDELNDATVGRRVRVNASIDPDAFVLSGSTQPKDFPMQMQLMAAYLTDPAFRPQGLERAKLSLSTSLAAAPTSPGGMLGLRLPEYLRGDKRATYPTLEALQNTKIEDIKSALAPMRSEPIEVIIVGDTTVEEAIARTAEALGALPPRREASYPPGSARLRFPAGSANPVRLTHTGRADQSMAIIAWPTSDFLGNPRLARATTVLAQVMQLRLMAELRERLAITYSPNASNTPAFAYPGYGVLRAAIDVPPEKLDSFFELALKIARDLRDAPPTQDELDRAVRPTIEQMQTIREGNDYWLSALAGAQRDPRRLEGIRTSISDLRSLTPGDIQRAAQAYLLDDRAFRIVAVPATPSLAGR